MVKNGDMQVKMLQDFLKRHFKTKKVKFGGKFKRTIVGYDNKLYQISVKQDKIKLKTHLTELLGEVFGFSEQIIREVVNQFI